jgi:hypothetical protein
MRRASSRPFEPGRSGNPGGRPRVVGKLRELARAHAPQAIKELARLAVKAKSEAARVAAIRDNKSEEELRVQLFADFEQIFPEYEMVPRKRLTVIDGTIETT